VIERKTFLIILKVHLEIRAKKDLPAIIFALSHLVFKSYCYYISLFYSLCKLVNRIFKLTLEVIFYIST